MTTTNVEKLVYNILERKNWIIEQVKQQTYLYEQQLASNLLIQGINPPSWFLNTHSHSLSSDPKELNKEELISDLLLPHARPVFSYSTGRCYFQNRLAGTGDNGELLDKLPNDIQDSNKDLDAGDEPRLVHESHGNHVGYTSNSVPGLPRDQADVRASNISIRSGQSPGRSQTSQLVFAQDGEKVTAGSHMVVGASNKGLDGGNEPMNLLDSHDADVGCIFSPVPKCSSAEQTEARILNIDIAPDQSLARLQRSKSRQKALELRTSGKATKSRLNHENNRTSFSGVTGVALYGIDPEEPDHYKGLSIINKSSDMSKGSIGKRVASRDLSNKSGTSNNCGRVTRSKSTCQWPSSVNEPLKLDASHETVRKRSGKENCMISQFEGIELSMENGTSGQMKRSQSSCLQHIYPNESLEICRTSMTEDDAGRLSQLMDYDHELVRKEIEVAIPSHVRDEAAMETFEIGEEESSKYAYRMTRSMTSSRQHSSANDAAGLGASYNISEVDGVTQCESTGKLSKQLDKANELQVVVTPPSEVDCTMTSSKNTCINELVSSAKSFGIAEDLIVAAAGSGATEEDILVSSLNRPDGNTHKDLSGSQLILPITKSSSIVNQEEKVPSAMAFELEGHPPCFGSNLDNFILRTESDGLVRLASDAHFVVKPKQLDFNVLEECSLSESCRLPDVERSPEQYLQRTCHKSLEPESIEKSNSDYPPKVSLEMQLLAQNEACEEKNDALKAYETNLEDCSKNETTLESYINGNHPVNNSEDGSEAVLPSGLHKSSYLDMHQPNCHLTEQCAEQGIDEGHFGGGRWTTTSQQQFSGSSPAPTLIKLVTEDPKSFLDEEVNMENKPDEVLDARRCCSVDDENSLQQHKHSFNCENEDTLASTEIMSLVDGGNNFAKEGLNTSASVGDPQKEDNNFGYSEFSEAQPTFMSTLPKNKFRHTKFDSWPQFKRRKIEYQHTNCFSASTSSREQKAYDLQRGHISSHSKAFVNESDAIPKLLAFSSSCEQKGSASSDMLLEKMDCHLTDDTFSPPILKSEQEVGKICFTEHFKVVQTPSTSKHEEFGSCSVSSLCKQATRESQGSFVENHSTSYPPNDILAAKSLCDEQELQKIIHVENSVDLADAEILTSSRSALLDSYPHLEGGPIGSPCNNELAFDQNLPVYEGFVLDEHSDDGGLDSSSRDEINFGELNTTCNSMQRASILEKICRNASICTPLVHFSSTYKPFVDKDLCLSIPNRFFEHTDLTSTLSFSEDAGNHLQATSMDEVDSTLQGMLYSDSLPYSGAQYSWNAKNCDTPIGRYCKRISSSSVNSEKQLSSNPELTCFRIEEDSCVVDENENADDEDDHIQGDIGLAETNSCANGEPFSETIEIFTNPPAAEKLHQIGGIDSSNAEIQSSVKQRLRNHCSNKKSKNWGKENQLSSVGVNSIKASESLHNRFSKAKLSSTTGLQRGTQRLSEKVKRNNIVSNVSSFIPLVQQKQAAAVCKGKRDIKVRSLEAAEAAKRQAEKKENERKIKKEALKLERAKIEEETLRQRELDKRKKEEELKKKDAELVARKRLREEEGRKEKERKKKRIGGGWQTHRAQEEKIFAGKGEKDRHCSNTDKSTNIRKESDNRTGKGQHMDKVSRDGNTLKKTELQTEFKTTRSNIQEFSTVPEIGETLDNCDGSTKSTSMLDPLSARSGIVTKTATEKSYEMSPYQHSDDDEEEEEEGDEVPAKKFIPSWASKNSVALVLSSQQHINPSVIFPRESFCSMNEALLPRHLQ